MKTRRSGPTRRGAGIGLTAALLLTMSLPAMAVDLKPTVSVGAGLRTEFSHSVNDATGAKSSAKSSDFLLDSVRLYLNGGVADNIKFTFDTEYSQATDNVQVLDAVARFEFSDKLNIWAGRFLPPTDRANLYGPYYADNWAVYTDGIQDNYPMIAGGRDNGVAYWGQFGILKVSLGAFDVNATTGKSEIVTAGRVMVDLWDPEPGYYLNGTYYGEKDILAIGLSGQTSASSHVYSVDFLMEKNLHGIGTFTVESEYLHNQNFGPYGAVGSGYGVDYGYYVLGAYLLPQPVGPGQLQILGKFGNASYTDPAAPTDPAKYGQHTSEVDLNYIVKSFNTRFSLYYLNRARGSGFSDDRTVGLGVQVQI